MTQITTATMTNWAKHTETAMGIRSGIGDTTRHYGNSGKHEVTLSQVKWVGSGL